MNNNRIIPILEQTIIGYSVLSNKKITTTEILLKSTQRTHTHTQTHRVETEESIIVRDALHDLNFKKRSTYFSLIPRWEIWLRFPKCSIHDHWQCNQWRSCYQASTTQLAKDETYLDRISMGLCTVGWSCSRPTPTQHEHLWLYGREPVEQSGRKFFETQGIFKKLHKLIKAHEKGLEKCNVRRKFMGKIPLLHCLTGSPVLLHRCGKVAFRTEVHGEFARSIYVQIGIIDVRHQPEEDIRWAFKHDIIRKTIEKYI